MGVGSEVFPGSPTLTESLVTIPKCCQTRLQTLLVSSSWRTLAPVPPEMDPCWWLLAAYLGVTKFELELVLAPDRSLKSTWGPGTHSEAPGTVPSNLL